MLLGFLLSIKWFLRRTIDMHLSKVNFQLLRYLCFPLTIVLFLIPWCGLEGPTLIGYHASFVGLLILLLLSLYSWRTSDIAFLFRREVFFLLILLSVSLWGWLLYQRYQHLGFSIFDTGIYTNILANLVYRGAFHSGVHDANALSNHFTPVLAFIAPLYSFEPHILWLPGLKVLGFLLSAWILLLISTELLGEDSPFRYALSIAWLLHRFVVFSMATEFQCSSLAVPFVLLAYFFAIKRQWRLLMFTLFFLLTFKENLALVWVSVGIFLMLYQSSYRLGLLVLGSGIAAGALIYFVIMPSFGEGYELSHIYRVAPFSAPYEKIQFLLLGLFSVGFLPLLSPKSILFILPLYALSFLSGEPKMWSYDFHYHDLALCGLFVGSAFGLKSISQDSQTRGLIFRLSGVVLFALLVRFHNRAPTQYLSQIMNEDRFATFEELTQLEAGLNGTESVYSLNTLGSYFVRNPSLTLLRKPHTISDLPADSVIVLSDKVSHWPLSSEEYERIKFRLDKMTRRGRLEKMDGFEHLRIYRRS